MSWSSRFFRSGRLAVVAVWTLVGCGSRTAPTSSNRDAAVAVAPAPPDAAPPVDAAPATRDVRPTLEIFFTRLGKQETAAIWEDAHPVFRAREVRSRAGRMMHMLVQPLGGYVAIEEFRSHAAKEPGDNAAAGTVRFEHGVAPYQVEFRDDGEIPRLRFFNIDLPKDLVVDETPEQARAQVDRAVTALLTGDLEKFRPLTHPALDEKLDPTQASELKTLITKMGAHQQVKFIKQEDCKGQCFELTLMGAKKSAKATFRLTKVFGRWHVLSFDLELL